VVIGNILKVYTGLKLLYKKEFKTNQRFILAKNNVLDSSYLNESDIARLRLEYGQNAMQTLEWISR